MAEMDDIPQNHLQHLINALIVIESKSGCDPFGFDPNIFDPAHVKLKKDVNCDQVYLQILIGNGVTARNKPYLQRIKVTHVLNAAECDVKTGPDYYQDDDIEYLGFNLQDHEITNISQYFEKAADFIDEAVNSKGIVYVHSSEGVSRSATLVIAFLMIKKNMTVHEALKLVKKKRNVRPNNGFLRQLVDLHLREKRDL